MEGETIERGRGWGRGRDNREDDGRMERENREEESMREKAGMEEERRVVWHQWGG